MTVDAGLVGVLHGLTATIGFWANANGQQMIKLLNATSTSNAGTSTALGNWLATNFPNMYGVKNTANYFSGKTTSYIANRYMQLFNMTGQKLDCQAMAVAFAIYTTTTELNSTSAGQSFATKHGFILSSQTASTNLKNRTWNVLTNGDAFATGSNGVYTTADNQSLTIWTLLQRTNSFAVNGVLWPSNLTVSGVPFTANNLQSQANVVFTLINQAGDIISSM